MYEDQAWTLNDIIKKLCEATTILLNEKNYDGHGYEEMQLCLNLAQKHLADRASEVGGVEPEVMPNEVVGGGHLQAIHEEYLRSCKKWGGFNSHHEGYSVIKEENEEIEDVVTEMKKQLETKCGLS